MPHRRTLSILQLCVLGLICALATDSLARGEIEKAYDVLKRQYGAYTIPDSPFGFAMKTRSLATDRYKFWRGTKDVFYNWAREHCADWIADKRTRIACHGDLHFGNLGSYASSRRFGALSIGLVDFDDAEVMPAQLDLLHAAITLRVLAAESNAAISEAEYVQAINELCVAYRRGIETSATLEELLANRPELLAKLHDDDNSDYSEELTEYTEKAERFRPAIYSRSGQLKEILQPARDLKASIAKALEQAASNDRSASNVLRYKSAAEFRSAIIDVALRVRLASSGSQGLLKYFVLVRQPFRDHEGDAILYLKQAIPSAAERCGLVSPTGITPGKRVSELAGMLCEPNLFLSSWCNLDSHSFQLTLKEPWSDEIEPGLLKSPAELVRWANVIGTFCAVGHRSAGMSNRIATILADGFDQALQLRSLAYTQHLTATFAEFTADPRVKQDIAAANAVIQAWEKQHSNK